MALSSFRFSEARAGASAESRSKAARSRRESSQAARLLIDEVDRHAGDVAVSWCAAAPVVVNRRKAARADAATPVPQRNEARELVDQRPQRACADVIGWPREPLHIDTSGAVDLKRPDRSARADHTSPSSGPGCARRASETEGGGHHERRGYEVCRHPVSLFLKHLRLQS